jgi:hypothetical protein
VRILRIRVIGFTEYSFLSRTLCRDAFLFSICFQSPELVHNKSRRQYVDKLIELRVVICSLFVKMSDDQHQILEDSSIYQECISITDWHHVFNKYIIPEYSGVFPMSIVSPLVLLNLPPANKVCERQSAARAHENRMAVLAL